MKKQDVIDNKRCGIKWYDHIVGHVGIDAIINRTAEIRSQSKFPTWSTAANPEWANVHWAFGNALMELYKPMKQRIRNNGQFDFNIDEVLTRGELQKLIDACGITAPYQDSWPRD